MMRSWGASRPEDITHHVVTIITIILLTCVHGKVGRGPAVRLDIDSPLGGVQVIRLEGPGLAQPLHLVHHLRAPVVPGYDV